MTDVEIREEKLQATIRKMRSEHACIMRLGAKAAKKLQVKALIQDIKCGLAVPHRNSNGLIFYKYK